MILINASNALIKLMDKIEGRIGKSRRIGGCNINTRYDNSNTIKIIVIPANNREISTSNRFHVELTPRDIISPHLFALFFATMTIIINLHK